MSLLPSPPPPHYFSFPEVLPDTSEGVTAVDEKADQDAMDKTSWQLKLAAHMTKEKKVAASARKALNVLTGADQRKANQWYGLALDNCLQVPVVA